jgi:nitrite reductase (NADH) small subunit
MAERWVRVDSPNRPAPGTSLAVTVEGWDLALHNVGGTLHCTSNVCPHQGRPLAGGILEGTRLTCPWHAWVFDVTTGQAPWNPWARIPCLPVKVEGGEIYVGMPEKPAVEGR